MVRPRSVSAFHPIGQVGVAREAGAQAHVEDRPSNLVIGDEHGFTAYAGIISGHDNVLLAPYGAVLGGQGGGVDPGADYGATVGGFRVAVNGPNAVAVGGSNSVAQGGMASVLGTTGSAACAEGSVVVGGERMDALASNTLAVGGAGQSDALCNDDCGQPATLDGCDLCQIGEVAVDCRLP